MPLDIKDSLVLLDTKDSLEQLDIKDLLVRPAIKDSPELLVIKDLLEPPDIKDSPVLPATKDSLVPLDIKDSPELPDTKASLVPLGTKDLPELLVLVDPPALLVLLVLQDLLLPHTMRLTISTSKAPASPPFAPFCGLSRIVLWVPRTPVPL